MCAKAQQQDPSFQASGALGTWVRSVQVVQAELVKIRVTVECQEMEPGLLVPKGWEGFADTYGLEGGASKKLAGLEQTTWRSLCGLRRAWPTKARGR